MVQTRDARPWTALDPQLETLDRTMVLDKCNLTNVALARSLQIFVATSRVLKVGQEFVIARQVTLTIELCL
jgi:hypothetical protein